MSTLAAVNETLVEIKGQLARQTAVLGNKLSGDRVKPMPSGPKDLTERERTGQTSGEAAREGLKERYSKPTGTGVSGIIDKVPNLPISTGSKGLDLLALGGLAVAFNKEIRDFLNGFLGGLKQSLQKEIDAFSDMASKFVEDNVTSIISGSSLGAMAAQNRFQKRLDGMEKQLRRNRPGIFRGGVGGDDFDQTAGSKTRTTGSGSTTKPTTSGSTTKGYDPEKSGTRQQMMDKVKRMSPGQMQAMGMRLDKAGNPIVAKTGRLPTNVALAEATTKPQSSGKKAVSNVANKIVKVDAKAQAVWRKALQKWTILKKIVGRLPAVGVVLEPLFATWDSIQILKDPNADPTAKRNAIVERFSVAITGTIGALIGGALGASAVTFVPVLGQTGLANIIGGVVGGVGGFFAGSFFAEEAAEYLVEWLFDNKPVDEQGIFARLSAWAADNKKADAKKKNISSGTQGKPNVNSGTVSPMSAPMDGSKPTPGTSGYSATPSRRNRDLPGGARQRRGLGISGSYNEPSKPTSTTQTMSPDALEGSTPSVSTAGPGAQYTPSVSTSDPDATATRIAAATPTQKAAMVNQAAIQQAAAGGNNITINRDGDTTINQEGGGGGTSTPVVVVKTDGDMPKIGAKIAYGMGL